MPEPDQDSTSGSKRRGPAQQFAADLARMGATVHWRDEREFDASYPDYGDPETRRVAHVRYDPRTGRFAGARTAQGKALLTKRGVRVYLGIYPYGRPRFDAGKMPSLGLKPK